MEVIGRQVRQMTRLVDDLLDVNRIAQGKITLQSEAVELARIVSETAETCRPLFDLAEVQVDGRLAHGATRGRRGPRAPGADRS